MLWKSRKKNSLKPKGLQRKDKIDSCPKNDTSSIHIVVPIVAILVAFFTATLTVPLSPFSLSALYKSAAVTKGMNHKENLNAKENTDQTDEKLNLPMIWQRASDSYNKRDFKAGNLENILKIKTN